MTTSRAWPYRAHERLTTDISPNNHPNREYVIGSINVDIDSIELTVTPVNELLRTRVTYL